MPWQTELAMNILAKSYFLTANQLQHRMQQPKLLITIKNDIEQLYLALGKIHRHEIAVDLIALSSFEKRIKLLNMVYADFNEFQKKIYELFMISFILANKYHHDKVIGLTEYDPILKLLSIKNSLINLEAEHLKLFDYHIDSPDEFVLNHLLKNYMTKKECNEIMQELNNPRYKENAAHIEQATQWRNSLKP